MLPHVYMCAYDAYVYTCVRMYAYMMLRVDVWSNIGLQKVIVSEPRIYSYYLKWPKWCCLTYLTLLVSASYLSVFLYIDLFDPYLTIWSYLAILCCCPTSTRVAIFGSIIGSLLKVRRYFTLKVLYFTYLSIFDSSALIVIFCYIGLNVVFQARYLCLDDIVLKSYPVEGEKLDIIPLFELSIMFTSSWLFDLFDYLPY